MTETDATDATDASHATHATHTTDAIEKEIVVRAPRSRVWRALTDSREFGRWFQAEMRDPFVPGKPSLGRVTLAGWEHLTFEVVIDRMEPERLFSWRWHPYPADPQRDYSAEPMTLVEFELEEIAQGTRIRVRESGFDRLPADRRDEAFRMNVSGWNGPLENIARHVDAAG